MGSLLHSDGARSATKPKISPRLSGERSVHTTCASWPTSREEDLAQPHSSSDENIGSSSPSASFDDPRSYRDSAVRASINSGMAEGQVTEAQSRDGQQRQSLFVQEYNQLAKNHGLNVLLFDEEESGRDYRKDRDTHTGDRRSWFARAFGKPPPPAAPRRPSRHSIGSRSDKAPGHKRSGSDPAAQSRSKRDTAGKLKNEALHTLFRICGRSFLYLPSEYATRSLMLPTCLRAAAQYLVQHGPETRGIFRISGSMRVVNELYDYYCADLEYGGNIAATVRSPNLPFHIKVCVHDVASLFKRLLAGLPGGILGQVSLFNALAEVHRKFSNRYTSSSEQTHMLPRLLALAIGSVPSQYQRELICAVFGLLSLIGHTSKVSSSLDGEEALLLNSEQMGYGALGIIFGPLLLGDLLETSGTESLNRFRGRSCTSASETAPSFPANTSPRYKADKRPKSMVSDRFPLSTLPMALDKIRLANDITETVISHWREVVCQMRAMGVMRKESLLHNIQQETQMQQMPPRNLRSCRSNNFTDVHERSLPPKTPVVYGTRLRKARSATIDRNPDAIVSAKRNTLGQVLQRPAEMTFEEFAARKKLKIQASSMSVTSETTIYVAPDVQESTVLPQSTEPLAAISSNNTNIVTRPHPAKPMKPHRVSSELPSLSRYRSMSPRMQAQSVANPSFPQGGENSTAPSQANGTSPSPWKVHLRPVRRVPDIPQVNSNPTSTSSPAKDTASWSPEETNAYRSNEAPVSKTAALISRIMNPRHQLASQENIADRGHSRTFATNMNLKSPYYQGTTEHSPFGRRSAEEGGLERRGDMFRCMLVSATPKEQSSTFQEVSTPTPKRYWRSRNIKPSPTTKDKDFSSMHATLVTTSIKGTVSSTRIAEANTHTTLAEIKNNARGLDKTCSKTAAAQILLSAGAVEKKTPDNRLDTVSTTERKDAKPTVAGSTVKAMAALFDNAVRRDIPATPPPRQTQKAVFLHENQAPSRERVLQCSSYCSPPNMEGMVTPLTVTPHTPHRPEQMDDAHLEITAAKRRNQLRLTKSEDRNGRISRVGKLAAIGNKHLTRSADRGVTCTTAEATLEKRSDWRRSTGPSRANSKRGTVSGRSAEDSKAVLLAERCLQKERPMIQELLRSLQAKTAECQIWKDRAEVAGRRVAALETLLASMSHGQSFFENREKLQPWVPCLGGASDTEDETVSEASLSTVLVRNRLGGLSSQHESDDRVLGGKEYGGEESLQLGASRI